MSLIIFWFSPKPKAAHGQPAPPSRPSTGKRRDEQRRSRSTVFLQGLRMENTETTSRKPCLVPVPFTPFQFVFTTTRTHRSCKCMAAVPHPPLVREILQGIHLFFFFSVYYSIAIKNTNNMCNLIHWIQERRYLLKEFPDLIFCPDFSKVLEVGCGSGSSLIPILRYFHSLLSLVWFSVVALLDWSWLYYSTSLFRGNKSMIVYACDCSTETLDTARQNVDAAEIASINDRFKPFYCDFALTKFPKWLICDSCRSQKQHECSSPGFLLFLPFYHMNYY